MKKALPAFLIVVGVLVGSAPFVLHWLLWFVSPMIGDRAGPSHDVLLTDPRVRFTMQNGKSFVITSDAEWSPNSVKHFIDLVRSGFYDKKPFFRAENWVVLCGPPLKSPVSPRGETSDNVWGSDGYLNEFNMVWDDGFVGATFGGPKNGTDFDLIIRKKEEPAALPSNELGRDTATIGKITQGMDVVDGIKKGDKVRSARVLK